MNSIQIYSDLLWYSDFPGHTIHRNDFVSSLYSINNNHYDLIHNSIFSHLFDFVGQMTTKSAFDLQFVNVRPRITSVTSNIQNHKTKQNVYTNTFTGAYFLKTDNNHNTLILSKPHANHLWHGNCLINKKNKFNAKNLKINPNEGSIYIWPSYLDYDFDLSDNDSIIIVLDIMCVPKNNYDT